MDHDDESRFAESEDFTQPIAQPIAPAENPGVAYGTDASGRLERDVTCSGCGYNLRGQMFDGSCVECGASVFMSLNREELANADPNWIKSLRNGMGWLLAGICIAIVFFIAIFILGFNISPPTPGGARPVALKGPMLVLGLLSSTSLTAIFAVSIWFVTLPEPHQNEQRISRGIARTCFLILFAFGFVNTLLSFVPSQDTALQIASSLLHLINLILFFVGYPAIMLYLRSLAKRIPQPGLAKQTLIVMWGKIICFAAIFGTMMLAIVFMISQGPGNANPSSFAVFGGYMCVVMLGIFVFGIWWIVLMCQYQAHFAHVYRESLTRNRGVIPSPA